LFDRFPGGCFRFAVVFFPDGFFTGDPPGPRDGDGASFPRRSSQYAGVRRRSRISYSTSAASSLTRLRNMSWRHSGMCSFLVRCTRMHSTQFPWRWQRVCAQGQSSTMPGARPCVTGIPFLRFMEFSAIRFLPRSEKCNFFATLRDSTGKDNLFHPSL
jgi:hypothetical protein